MKLAGRLAAAIEVLETLEAQRRPVAHVLKDWGHAHRFAGSGDRNAIGNLVYDALRHRRSLAARMGDDSARAAILAVVHFLPGYLDGPLPDFAGDAHAPEPLSEAERAALAAPAPEMEPAVAANCSDWLWPMMQRVFGDDTQAQLGAMAARAPLDLRVNLLRSKPERIEKGLSRYTPKADLAFPALRRIEPLEGFGRAPHIASDEAFQKGWIEIQDAGSQLAAELAFCSGRSRTILDFCTGAGGKALALSGLMAGQGQVFAHDADRRRMADLWPRVKRSGAHNIQVIDPDALERHELSSHGADCVLLDAPCTGTGTWRRSPDTKWRVAEGSLADRMAEQNIVLAQGAKLVRPGGRLVYITCSLLAEENEDRVVAFLASHGDFAPMAAEALMGSLDRPDVPRWLPSVALDRHAGGALGIRLTPLTSATDGFFIACMTRAGA